MAFQSPHRQRRQAMTTRSQAARAAAKLRPDADIFKVTVLGLAKTGKTSLCTQAVNHFFPTVYRHTHQTDSFITRVEPRASAPPPGQGPTPGAGGMAGAGAATGAAAAAGETTPVMAYTQLDRARRKVLTHARIPAYQLELQDTPGELWRKEGAAGGGGGGGGTGGTGGQQSGGGSEANRPTENTPEHRFTTELAFHNPRPANPRQFPRKPDYQTPEERYRENVNIIFGDYEEAAKLRAETDALIPPSEPDRDNSNHLLRARPTMGYIVVFDPSSRTSFEKAKRIIAYARLQHHPRTAGLEGLYLPLYLFANKMDLYIGKGTRSSSASSSSSSSSSSGADGGRGGAGRPERGAAGFRRPHARRLSDDELREAARRKWAAATNAFADDDPPLLEEAKAYVDSMCNASSGFRGGGAGDSARQMKSWSAYNLNSKFVQLCYGSVKLNQVRFWDDERRLAGGASQHPEQIKQYRLEELFNRMAAQMAGQVDFVQRVFAKAERLDPRGGQGAHGRPANANASDGPRRRRKPRRCNYCLCFLWVVFFPVMLLLLFCRCCWRGCTGATPVYIPDQALFDQAEENTRF